MKKSIAVRMARNCVFALLLLLLPCVQISAAEGEDFRSLIEERVLPVMERSAGYSLSEEDFLEICTIMEESGRTISFDSLQTHTKDGTMRALLSCEFGGTLGEWRVEDQAWYAQMMVDLGLCETSELCIPQDGEISQEQAVRIAAEYLYSKMGVDVSLEDQYQCSAQYVADSVWRARWFIEFSTRDPRDNTCFQVQISPYGEVDEQESVPAAPEEPEEARLSTEDGIDQATAIETAWNVVKTEYGLDDARRDLYEVWSDLRNNNMRMVWNITFFHSEEDNYGVRIEQETGEILEIYDAGDGVG